MVPAIQGFLPLRSLETGAGLQCTAQKTHRPDRRVPSSKATQGMRTGLDRADRARSGETPKTEVGLRCDLNLAVTRAYGK